MSFIEAIRGRVHALPRFAAQFATVAALMAASLGSASVAEAAAPRDSSGCWKGPRGGLHCPRYSSRETGRMGGGETRAQRERRFARECRGQRNAGACTGYGSWY